MQPNLVFTVCSISRHMQPNLVFTVCSISRHMQPNLVFTVCSSEESDKKRKPGNLLRSSRVSAREQTDRKQKKRGKKAGKMEA